MMGLDTRVFVVITLLMLNRVTFITTEATQAACRDPIPELAALTELRRNLLSDYSTNPVLCPEVDLLLVPFRITVDTYTNQAAVDVGLLMTWKDPSLKRPGDYPPSVRLSVSQVWVPPITSASRQGMKPTSNLSSRNAWVFPGSGRVTTFRTTQVLALCDALRSANWPHDALNCSFSIGSGAVKGSGGEFALTQGSVVDELCHDRALDRGCFPMERVVGWKINEITSHLDSDRGMLSVAVELHRLSGQYEAVVVYPAPVLSALLLTSLMLPPSATGRPVLLTCILLLHFLQSILLSFWLHGQSATSPNLVTKLYVDWFKVLLYRESLLLVGLAVLQWLLSRSLALATHPMRPARPAARALLLLRRPLLLSDITQPDKESLSMAEVLDRLTFLTLMACYVALMSIRLPK